MVEFAFRVQYETLRRGTVLVTGASKGIGRAAVDALLEDGYVVFAGVRKQEDSEALSALGNPALKPVLLDVTDEASIAAAYDTVVAEIEKLNKPFSALVNNAGFGPTSPIEFHDLKSAKDIYETNVFGALAVTQKFLPLIRKHHSRIINISSILGKVSVAGFGIYASSKFALEAISDSLRLELKPYRVSVSVIQPGIVKTPFHETSKNQAQEITSPEAKATYPQLYSQEAHEFQKRFMAKGAEPKEVSKAIIHATSSTHPKTRYPCANFDGLPAWAFLAITWALPDRIADTLFS